MKLFDENLLAEIENDGESTPGGLRRLGQEDKDLLKSLEEMAEELEEEDNKPK